MGGEDPLGRDWQPTPVFLLGEFHGQSSLVGYSPWGRTELDTTEATEHTLRFIEYLLCVRYDISFGDVCVC